MSLLERGKAELSETLDLFLHQYNTASRLVDIGVPQLITAENFPLIDEKDPDMILLLQKEAFSARMGRLNAQRRSLPGLRDQLTAEMLELEEEFRMLNPQYGDVEKIIDIDGWHWPSPVEIQSMHTAIDLGTPDLVTRENFPAWASISDEQFTLLKLVSCKRGIERCNEVLGMFGNNNLMGTGKANSAREAAQLMIESLIEKMKCEIQILSPADK